MAQACVMVQPNRQESSHQQPLLSSPAAKSPTPASFITSSVRKRKAPQADGEIADAAAPAINDRRCKPIMGSPDPPRQPRFAEIDDAHRHAAEHHAAQSLALPEAPLVDANCVAGQQTTTTTTLFSPVFPAVIPPGGAAGSDAATDAAAPAAPAANASRDTSTGTATSVLDQLDSEHVHAAPIPAVTTTAEAPQYQALAAFPQSPTTTAAPVIVMQQQQQQIQQQSVEEEDVDYDDDYDFDPFVFIKRLPPLHCCIEPRTTFLLPRQTRHSKRKTLVLDLDETLVHSTLDGDCIPDFTFPVHIGPICHNVAVRKRPHLHTFLERVAELFEVVIFTASQQVYAEQLLDLLDPGRRLIKHRVYRDSCVLWEGNYLKDLTSLGRDLAHTLIIDNSPQAFGFQLDNGVPIESWYDDDHDDELLKLIPFLEDVAQSEDVRPAIASKFNLRQIVEAAPSPPRSLVGTPAASPDADANGANGATAQA